MKQAIGLIEVQGYGTAISIADVMLKVAAVELIGVQRAKGHGWMTLEVEGDVAAVQAAVDAGKARAVEYNHFVSALVIPRPAESLDKLTDNIDYPKKAAPVIPPVDKKEEITAAPALKPTSDLTVQPEAPPKPEPPKPVEEKKTDKAAKEPEAKPPKTDKPAEKKAAKPAEKKEKPADKKASKKPKNTKKKQ